MMKKLFNYMLMATLVVSLGTTITACSDDDDDKKGGNEELKADDPYEKNGEVAYALYRVVGTLCELDSLPDNWKTATYEPTKGKILDASQPLVRSVTVADLSEAVSMFRTLTGENLADNATTATWSKDGVGSLKFTATNSSAETAVIDVNIKQMPKLSQLRLVPASAMGENGSFTGDPYYHIGDVVKDGDGRHWICVRSAYSPAGKEDTHWVTMQLLAADSKSTGFKTNVRLIKAKTGKNGQHKIQQKLGNSEETKHLKYFAQLMYTLNNPDKYASRNAKGDIMEDGLGDLGVKAHNDDYVKNLAKYWNDHNIWDLVLPGVIDKGQFVKGQVKKSYFDYSIDGITMLYYGHNFSMLGMGSDCTIYTCQQSGDFNSTQTLGEKTWTYNANENTKFDCTDFALYGEAKAENTNAGYTGRAIVVVQASGKQLNGGTNPGPTNKIGKCTDVLVGHKEKLDQVEEVITNTNDNPQVGHIISDNGNVFATYSAAKKDSKYVPVAMIVYNNHGKMNELDESTGKSVLAISLYYANPGSETLLTWGPTNAVCGTVIDQDKDYTKFISTSTGISITKKLCNDSHEHPAAESSRDVLKDYLIDDEPGGHFQFMPSQFFLPTPGQWVWAFKGMNVWDYSAQGAKLIKAINDLYDKAGVPEENRITYDITLKGKCRFWTSIEASEEYAYAVEIDESNGVRFVKVKKSEKLRVFPFILYG